MKSLHYDNDNKSRSKVILFSRTTQGIKQNKNQKVKSQTSKFGIIFELIFEWVQYLLN